MTLKGLAAATIALNQQVTFENFWSPMLYPDAFNTTCIGNLRNALEYRVLFNQRTVEVYLIVPLTLTECARFRSRAF